MPFHYIYLSFFTWKFTDFVCTSGWTGCLLQPRSSHVKHPCFTCKKKKETKTCARRVKKTRYFAIEVRLGGLHPVTQSPALQNIHVLHPWQRRSVPQNIHVLHPNRSSTYKSRLEEEKTESIHRNRMVFNFIDITGIRRVKRRTKEKKE